MNITLKLDLHTQSRCGATRGTITMFTKTVVFATLTGEDLVTWLEHGYIRIDDMTFRPQNLIVRDDTLCICEGIASETLFQKQDSLEYYQSLIQRGWSPNIESSKAIQSDNYPNFRPEHF